MSQTNQPKQSPLEIQELLSAILSMTDRTTLLSCALVSKSWHIPALHALWRYVQWKPLPAEEQGSTGALFLEGLAKYGRYTLELQDNTMADMDLIARHCPHLHCLRLSITTPEDESLANMLLHAPQISSLHMFCCRRLSAQSLRSVATLTHLQTLDLRNLQQVDEASLMAVFTGCPELKNLYLEDVDLMRVSLRELRPQQQQETRQLKLETLSLIRSSPRSELIVNLLRCSPKLSNLSLARNYRVVLPELALQEVHASLVHVTQVNLESCKFVSNLAMVELFASCPRLVRVNVMGTTIEDSGLEQLANSCTAIERLNLALCHYITDAGARYVLDHCTRLKSIDLTSHLELTASIFFGAPWQCVGLESITLVDLDMSRPEHPHQPPCHSQGEQQQDVRVSTHEGEGGDSVVIHCDPNHAAMFDQLAQLQCLQDLTVGGSNMSLRLSDGLDRLGDLPCLESWHVRQLEGTLEDDEIHWLIEAWPATLKRVRYDRGSLATPWLRHYRRRRPRLLFA